MKLLQQTVDVHLQRLTIAVNRIKLYILLLLIKEYITVMYMDPWKVFDTINHDLLLAI